MTISRHDFNKIASKPARKREAPFSLRLSFEEKAALKKMSGGQPLGACIKAILRKAIAEHKGVPASPTMDKEALGRILGQLGKSRLSNNLNQLAKAVNMGALPVTPDTEKELRQACSDVAAMRSELMAALQLRGRS